VSGGLVSEWGLVRSLSLPDPSVRPGWIDKKAPGETIPRGPGDPSAGLRGCSPVERGSGWNVGPRQH
jgi:hypothetical protein